MSPSPPAVDSWAPLQVDEVIATFEGAPFRWWIAGGRALELHVGRTWRAHADIDVSFRRSDAADVHRWLEGWDLWVAVGGKIRSWAGGDLDEERRENNVWARRRGEPTWAIDLTVGSGEDREWVYRRDARIRRLWRNAVLLTPAGVPYLAPDLQLLFKSKGSRKKDDVDALEVIPELGPRETEFLHSHLEPHHPWRPWLRGR